jgi:hypothetical protein
MQDIAIGVIFAVAGAIGLWGDLPEHRLPNGEPSMWALRGRVGFGLFFVVGLFVAVRGSLRTLGLLDRL